jgi:hypothetical protein
LWAWARCCRSRCSGSGRSRICRDGMASPIHGGKSYYLPRMHTACKQELRRPRRVEAAAGKASRLGRRKAAADPVPIALDAVPAPAVKHLSLQALLRLQVQVANCSGLALG